MSILDVMARECPEWDTDPPPWAPRRPKKWYDDRTGDTAAVVAAAERAAAAVLDPAPER